MATASKAKAGGTAKRKKNARRAGRKLQTNRAVTKLVRTALGAVGRAKTVQGYGAAWRELHHVESRLTRLV